MLTYHRILSMAPTLLQLLGRYSGVDGIKPRKHNFYLFFLQLVIGKTNEGYSKKTGCSKIGNNREEEF